MDNPVAFSHVFDLEAAYACAIFGAVMLIMLGALLVGRARRGRTASTREEHSILEGLTAFLLLLDAVFLVLFTAHYNSLEIQPVGADAVSVHVTGFQWCWRMSYDGTPITIHGTCYRGDYPTFVLPEDRPIKVWVTSNDVVHEWWVPAFKDKIEAFPHHWNELRLRLGQTGTFAGRCSEFCGLFHDEMRFWVKVVTPTQYAAWIASGGTAPLRPVPGSSPPPRITPVSPGVPSTTSTVPGQEGAT